VTDGRAAALYALALVPVGAAAVALSGWIMDVSHQPSAGPPSGVDGWALNVVPAFAVGLIGYWMLARYVGRRLVGGHAVSGHLRRGAVLYIVTVGLGVLMLHDAGRPEFWSFGQIVLWPWLVAVAGIFADALTVLRSDRKDTTGI
jgi:hypothetical protein